MRVEAQEKFWFDKSQYDRAERHFYEGFGEIAGKKPYCPLASEIAKAREHIQSSLEKMDDISVDNLSSLELLKRIVSVENGHKELRQLIENLQNLCHSALKRISSLERHGKSVNSKGLNSSCEDIDLFVSESEEESEETSRIRAERLKAYESKKTNKPSIIAKSCIVLDVKPWDDATDLGAMETNIRKITMDGLLWGSSKLVPVAFGIHKLSISCVVEDEKVSVDLLTEEIEKFEEFVQSVDVAVFNKI